MYDLIDPRLVWMPKDQRLATKGFCQLLHNRWFVVHPDTGALMFFQSHPRRLGQLAGASPQCHPNQDTAIRLQQKLYPWAAVSQFVVVACPIQIEDFV